MFIKMIVFIGKKVCFNSYLTLIYIIMNVKCQENFIKNEPSISEFFFDEATSINNESNIHSTSIDNNDMTNDWNHVIHELSKRTTDINPPKYSARVLNEREMEPPMEDVTVNLEVPYFKNRSITNKNKSINVQKCCEDNEIYFNGSCQDYDNFDFNVDIYDSNDTHYWLIHDYTPKTVKKMIDCSQRVSFPVVSNMSDVNFWLILENGKVYFKHDYSFVEQSDYCISRGLNESKEPIIMLLLCVPSEVYTSQFYAKVIKFCALALSVFSLIILVTYKYNNKTYPNDCKNCFMFMFIALAIAYAAWALYTIVSDSWTGFLQFLWVVRFYCCLSFHCFLLFFYIELHRNVSLTTKRSTNYLKFYIIMANVIPIIILSIFFSLLGEVPSTPFEDHPTMKNGVALYYSCYYMPCAVSIISCCIISARLHLAQVSAYKPNLNETLRRLMRQNSRTPAGEERILYKKCYFLIALIFISYTLNITLFTIPLFLPSEAPLLDNYNSITYILGVFCALLFIPSCMKLCGNNNLPSNQYEQTELRIRDNML